MTENSKRGAPEPVAPLKDSDAFWLTDLYPNAKALFEHEQVSLESASIDCIVILDANVLLLPFEFSSASIGEVEKVYKVLCADNRLIVPGQAVREFYKNRSNKITAIADAIDAAITKAKKQIFEKTIPLLENDADYISARKIGKDLVGKGLQVAAKLEKVNERLKDEVGADRVSLLYRNLLVGCVADFVVNDGDRDAVCKEVARRARLKIAPGYKDQQKEDGGIGDYLVWRTILQEGENRQVHCIFVTEEEKPDWWVKRHGTFQPRPELIEEYRRASGGKSLHLLPLSGLLSAFKANEEVVQQVQELEERKRVILDSMQRKWALAGSSRLHEKRQEERHDLNFQILFHTERIRQLEAEKDNLNNALRDNEYPENQILHKIRTIEDESLRARMELKNLKDKLINLNDGSSQKDDFQIYLNNNYLLDRFRISRDEDGNPN